MNRTTRPSDAPVRYPIATDDVTTPTIWLVDDSPVQGEMSRQTLARQHNVRVFDRAAPMLERLSEGERPDILVLDWHMPEISGLEACRFVRTIADGAELPIIVLTATGDRQDLLDSLAAGANDFVKKPVDEEEVNARVAALVRTKRLHARLAATESALRDEASFRERFLAILAHDLRQPLNVFALGSDALAAPDSSPETRQRVNAMFVKATARMQRMIGELLDFSRSRPQGGGMPIAPQPVDLTVLVHAVVEEVRLAHPSRDVTFDVGAGCTGTWDPDRLAQVVANLAENALAHSHPPSPVRIDVKCSDAGVAIMVENHGEPLDEELQATLFRPFRRGSARGAKDRGLGLGLYIVDQIARAHGGMVTIQCDQGLTRFVVTLPRSLAHDSTPTTDGATTRSVPRILVVDDREDARVLCAASLAREGFQVDEASDGIDALEKVARARPDLIFMDLSMPRMDGWEATRRLKSDPRNSGIVIIALTGESSPEALQRARAAGAAHVSRRPCSTEELLALVQRYLAKAA